jgi:hypothetical protein
MRRTGPSSRAARSASAERDVVADTLVVVGCALSLGLVAVSVFLNFRMGRRSADTEIDGWAYGLAAAMGDGLKAVAPFVMYWGWTKRDALAVMAAGAVFVVISGYSLTAALGFAELHRAAKQSEWRVVIERHADLRKDMARTEARLAQLVPQRSEGELEKAVAAVLARVLAGRGRTVDQVSKGCTVSRAATREACAEVARLAEEWERAREQTRLEAVLRETRMQLQAMNTSASGPSEDPQVDALSRAAALMRLEPDRKDVQFGLSLLLALLVELGSGLGFYVSTTPWRMNAGKPEAEKRHRNGCHTRRWTWRPTREKRVAMASNGLGAVELYAMGRLEPRVQGEVGGDELFEDYLVWCRCRGDTPYMKRLFVSQMKTLGEEVGIPTLETWMIWCVWGSG